MRHRLAALAAVPIAALTLTACGGHKTTPSARQQQQAVCVDQTTQQRLPDNRCGTVTGAYDGGVGWLFLPYAYGYPGIGQTVTGGSLIRPSRAYRLGGAPTAGAKAPTPQSTTKATAPAAPKATAKAPTAPKPAAPKQQTAPKAPAPAYKAPAPAYRAPAPAPRTGKF